MSRHLEAAGFKALIFTSSSSPPTVMSMPTPEVVAGTALVRPLASPIVHYSKNIFFNANLRNYSFPLPIVAGTSAIARLIAAPPDAPTLLSAEAGQLCWIDPVIRACDDLGDTKMLQGLSGSHSAKSRVLMDGEWRHGTFAEIAKVPLESIHLLNQARLLGKREDGGLAYKMEDLCYISSMLVPYGGLADVGIKPGETVVIAPATGAFGSAAVIVALAMGADVVAMGRNEQSLADLKAVDPHRIKTVKISGDVDTDKAAILSAAGRAPEVFFDISPPGAAQSSHIMAGIMSLRIRGRVSFMGGPRGDISFPYRRFVIDSLTLKGTWMYTSAQADELIRMVESGRLKIGSQAGIKCAGIFELEQWEEAFTIAQEKGGRPGCFVTFCPNGKPSLQTHSGSDCSI